jgi:hypothetical protein
MRSASGGADVPKRRVETSRGAEYSRESRPRSDAGPVRRSPQCILRKENALDEATHYLYGCSFQHFKDALYKDAYDRGYQTGLKEGRAAGRRAAKGLPEARKKRGRPPNIGDSLSSLLVFTVEERKQGESVSEAVRYFLRVMRRGAKETGHALELPTEREAIRAYYRHRKRPRNPFLLKSGDLFSKLPS